jgi:hypothetical protein
MPRCATAGISVLCCLICGCALNQRKSLWIEPTGEKHALHAAIPRGSTIELATSVMKGRGYDVEVVRDGEFVEGGNIVGGPPPTAYIKHADFLKCVKTQPLRVGLSQLLDAAIVVKDGTTGDILLNSFTDGQ